MLISACINSCRKRFFRLKSLCDIAEIIYRYSEIKWDELIRRTKEYQCNNIVYTALLVTKTTLGCKLPEEMFDKLIDSTSRSIIIRYLVHHFSRNISLSSSYPYFKKSKKNNLGRKAHFSLVLPYATYEWYQLWRVMKNIWRTKPWVC